MVRFNSLGELTWNDPIEKILSVHPAHSPARIIVFSASVPNFIWGGEVRAPGRVRAPYYCLKTLNLSITINSNDNV